MTTVPVSKEFVWGLLAFTGLIALVPQLLTRTGGGDKLFDNHDGEDAWVNRGLRVSAVGLMILLAFALYFYPTT